MIKIYTDGGCSLNPGPGGSAYVIIKNEEVVFERIYSFKYTTNNFCELFAVLQALNYVISNNILECQVYSDSTYVVKGINEWMNKWMDKKWRGSNGHQIKNIELWKDVANLWNRVREVSNISIHHIKGHSDNQWNNYADKLAVKAVKMNHENNKE